jgi:hypothetical protein
LNARAAYGAVDARFVVVVPSDAMRVSCLFIAFGTTGRRESRNAVGQTST